MADAVFAQCRDAHRRVGGGNTQLDPYKFYTVESGQSLGSADPKKAVVCLKERSHGIGWQTVCSTPDAQGLRRLHHLGVGSAGPDAKKRQDGKPANQTETQFSRRVQINPYSK